MTGPELRERVGRLLADGSVENGPREPDWIIEEAKRAVGAGAGSLEDVALDMARRRAAGEPLQYVLGSQAFRKLVLEVGPGVFIPRLETEEVAGAALTFLPQRGCLVDLCTGSGAIALAVLDERPDATVYATEVSPDAMRYAVRNAKQMGLSPEQRKRFVTGDLFEGLPEGIRREVDVIVANPPYVAPSDRASLPLDVAGHEPDDALFAPGDGLGVIERIAEGSIGWLGPGGRLVLEIGETQGGAVTRIFEHHGYESGTVASDLAGKERIAMARTPAEWSSVTTALQGGGVAIVPTDTVVGLAAGLHRPEGVDAIFEMKARSRDKPLPVLIHNMEAAAKLGVIDARAEALAHRFWPGPLTLVLRRALGVSVDLGAGKNDTIALRIPHHPDLLRLLAAVGPLATTSANRSGEPPAKTLREAQVLWPGAAVMLAGEGRMRESTVVSLVDDVVVLRAGAISAVSVIGELRK